MTAFKTTGKPHTLAIDESFPDSLPAAVVADWKSRDGTGYDNAIAEIKKHIRNLPAGSPAPASRDT